MTYKFKNPHEWLGHWMAQLRDNPTALYHLAYTLASEVEPDAVQEMFQDQMKQDGYFDELVVCPGSDGKDCTECEHHGRHSWTPECAAAGSCPGCVPVEEA